uniref:Uncharacterized protein n=1 Tax=Heterorhabditis bacteriophora TaxID=37862 RepID=A0A1I7WIH3_HETBA
MSSVMKVSHLLNPNFSLFSILNYHFGIF